MVCVVLVREQTRILMGDSRPELSRARRRCEDVLQQPLAEREQQDGADHEREDQAEDRQPPPQPAESVAVGSLLTRRRLCFVGSKLVLRMSFLMVISFNQSQQLVFFPNCGRFPGPAEPRNLRDELMVVLSAPLLYPVCISRAIHHEGVHRPCDFALLLGFSATNVRWSIHPGFHVLDWNVVQVLGQLAQGCRKIDFWSFVLCSLRTTSHARSLQDSDSVLIVHVSKTQGRGEFEGSTTASGQDPILW